MLRRDQDILAVSYPLGMKMDILSKWWTIQAWNSDKRGRMEVGIWKCSMYGVPSPPKGMMSGHWEAGKRDLTSASTQTGNDPRLPSLTQRYQVSTSKTDPDPATQPMDQKTSPHLPQTGNTPPQQVPAQEVQGVRLSSPN